MKRNRVTGSHRLSGEYEGFKYSGAILAYEDNSLTITLEFKDKNITNDVMYRVQKYVSEKIMEVISKLLEK